MSLGWLSIGVGGNISLTGLNVDDGTLYVDENGNKVGIGNLNPESKLHVNKARTFGGTYSRTGTTVTVTTSEAHGFSSGDIIRLYFLSGTGTSGRYEITVTSTTQFTVTDSVSGTTAGTVDATLEFYFSEDTTYTIGTNSNTITIVMNQSGVTRHNLNVGDELFFAFYSGGGKATGDFISGGFSPPPDTSASVNGNYYINTINGNIFRKTSGNWSYYKDLQTNSAGGPYTGAAAYFVGSGAPSSGLGAINDFYVDKDNGNIYRKTALGWGSPIDTVLLAGQTIYHAASEPGNNGDYFLVTGLLVDSGDVYYKSSGSWMRLGTVRDSSGNTGLISTGFLTGVGAPSSGLGALENVYVDADGGDVYQKYSFGWYLTGNVLDFKPLSGTYRITNVSLDSNVLIVAGGWNMVPSVTGGVRFIAPLSESEREGSNGMVIYSSNSVEPSTAGTVNYAGGLFVAGTTSYAQNRGSGISLGGVGYNREQMTFARVSGVQSTGTDLRSGDMVLETMHENGPETYIRERLRIKAAGNVGIGTTNPQALLSLDKGSAGNFLLLNGFKYGNGGAGIFFRNDFVESNSYNCSIINHDLGDGSADGISINAFGGISLCTGSNSRQERMRLTYAGNVGIGTTNPTKNMHIWGFTGTGLKISSSASVLGSSSVAFHASTTGAGDSDYHVGSITSVAAATDAESRLDFNIGSGSILIATMKGNGNVGIGTINPTSKLHINPAPTLVGNPDFNLVPTGCIMMWALGFEPSGWLFCRGQAVSRTTYSRLYNVLADTYGSGDGSTTFNLPDLRGRSPLGVNTNNSSLTVRALAQQGGAETHTLTIAEMPSHSHTWQNPTNGHGGSGGIDDGVWALPRFTDNTGSTGGSQPHNNMSPFLVLNFIIKY